MSDVLIFLGSPRKNGNSEVLAEAICRGIEKGGDSYEIVRLAALEFSPCIGCGGCDKTGHCVLEDQMIPLYEKIESARRVILASPIYFYSITAQAKAFVDRCQALWNRKYLQVGKGVWQQDSDRKGYLVAVAATRGERVFEGAILTMKYACDAMGLIYGGEFSVRGIDRRGEMAGDLATLARAEEFGRRCLD
ncbi:MAG: flavodoxin family protein [Desulfurivibrionaceae bacterium]|nr:flavodoxin family protein [Desulfobulbales bacterium]MDT8334699.1 flavodoxin family protein [Desulfurivibrionaceae bacterium]